jgi:hypothetical protein
MFTLLLTLLIPWQALAEAEISSKGELRMESRFFTNDNNSQTEDFGYGLAGRLEVDHSWKDLQSRMQVFSRVDRMDSSRERLNIEELYTQWVREKWVWFAGYKTLNWSTAEAFHPTDVINSRNFDGPFENAEKLGELMLGGQFFSEYVNLWAFYMPTLARPQLPEQTNRLSFAPQIPGIQVNPLEFVDNNGEIRETDDFVQQWAVRMQIPIESWEFNFYWVHHYDRTDFANLVSLNDFSNNVLMSEVDHYAFAFQYVWESWIFKSENAYRDFQENTFIPSLNNTLVRRDYGISSLAIEYLMSHSNGSDTTFILEFQEIYGVEKELRYLINPFQRDMLIGARYAYNDAYGKEIFVGLIGDLERGRELLASASYTQRLSDVWKIKVAARYIDAPQTSFIDLTGLRPLNNDHQLDINLSRFF